MPEENITDMFSWLEFVEIYEYYRHAVMAGTCVNVF
jgi:hypothetical protein